MKKNIIAVVLALFAQLASAQVVVHDYLTITWKPHQSMRTLIVNATGSTERSVDLRALNGKIPALGADRMSALALVQEHEVLGYELFAFSTHTAHEGSIGETWVWLMRKPKQ